MPVSNLTAIRYVRSFSKSSGTFNGGTGAPPGVTNIVQVGQKTSRPLLDISDPLVFAKLPSFDGDFESERQPYVINLSGDVGSSEV